MEKLLAICSTLAATLACFFFAIDDVKAAPSDDFVTIWRTTAPGQTITIPTQGGGYNYDVDWGDSSASLGQTGNASHLYAAAGDYEIRISGTFPRIFFADSGDHPEIISIEQWGTGTWSSMNHAFWGATNLVVNATDIPDLSAVTDAAYMFHGTVSLFTIPNVNSWDVSNITDMKNMFSISAFNSDISSWNVSNVTDMSGMFYSNEEFNQDISSWDVSSVTAMYDMFSIASYFNQDISGWDVSSVVNMNSMFYGAIRFNQNLSTWSIAQVVDMRHLFDSTNLSVSNYDAILQGWSLQSVQNNITLDADTREYCTSSQARSSLITLYSWTINDGGAVDSDCVTTQTPTLIAPVTGSSYSNTTPFTVSFLLPERLAPNSLALNFVPTEGSPVSLSLRDAEADVTNTFSFDLTGNFISVSEIISATGASIPAGTYTVTLSYQDELANPAATASATNVTIIDGPLPEGTLRFHLFTDEDGDGTQDSGEEDGFDEDDAELTITINGENGEEEVETDEDGNIDSALTIGDYTLTITAPRNYLVKGGSSTIAFTITADAVTDIGSRGIYYRGDFNTHSSGYSGGGSSSNNHSSSSVSHSNNSSSNSSSSNRSNTSSTSDALPTPVAKEPACLKSSTSIQFSDNANNAATNYLSSFVFANDLTQHLIKGYNNGTFGPQNALTRFEALAIAMRSNCISGGNHKQFTHRNTQFSDVPQDDSEQSRIIGEAFHRGIITGIGDKFYPDRTVSYAELVKMTFTSSAYFAHGQPLKVLTKTFSLPADTTFIQPLEYASRLNLLPANFGINTQVNRQAMADYLQKYIQALQTIVTL